MKNKKANLLPTETLKIVLGVIGIVLLTYLLFALYSSNVKERKLIEAKSTIDLISKNIVEINKNSSYVGTVTEMIPTKWFLYSFVGNSVKPNQCSGKDCICLCDDVYKMEWIMENRQENECSKFGACLVVENLMGFPGIELTRDPFTSIKINKKGKWMEIKKI